MQIWKKKKDLREFRRRRRNTRRRRRRRARENYLHWTFLWSLLGHWYMRRESS
ncbi:hypothetical protein Ahy_B06g084764 isoform C [Arachis hypogaea]|uniref:Uncharacterized protein n=1 Tax=Arachis hypogaea TaxID=3818 RepID=A0A444YSR4_ARAHY|nr:hypothetical protein Ahy_B06g084764 isoform C [Arachis hypogaea]